ncbi:MAG: phosphate--acyl-ACP acyltransferase [Deltaproteobacteria bacterium HGW-Deltaproteobacteria-21]|nr:MAG: phosphate--acyl-ACP acyltransferase [Deltaproteobacteria bacterium HGW-Deltaproteobacteria-21]
MRIAVDAMGGDQAPEVVIQGALQAASEWGYEIILVGREDAIEAGLMGSSGRTLIHVHHCSETILMGESPVKAVRQKKDSSIRVAFGLVKRGEADAVVSAGNSGAVLTAAVQALGRIKGVDRPAFVGIFPGVRGDVILIDVGANVDCRPAQLFQFGVMAHSFALSCMNMKDPEIGLLSIGQEGGKGNEQVRQAHDLFMGSRLRFAGNVEGRDILSGRFQIIVCDGFVGNVVLKLVEGMAETLYPLLNDAIGDRAEGGSSLEWLKKKLDYSEYGGAPILGVRGVGIVCHGGSSAKAIKNGIRTAAEYVRKDLPNRLASHIDLFRSAPGKQVHAAV